jgi:hypothetical protein
MPETPERQCSKLQSDDLRALRATPREWPEPVRDMRNREADAAAIEAYSIESRLFLVDLGRRAGFRLVSARTLYNHLDPHGRGYMDPQPEHSSPHGQTSCGLGVWIRCDEAFLFVRQELSAVHIYPSRFICAHRCSEDVTDYFHGDSPPSKVPVYPVATFHRSLTNYAEPTIIAQTPFEARFSEVRSRHRCGLVQRLYGRLGRSRLFALSSRPVRWLFACRLMGLLFKTMI